MSLFAFSVVLYFMLSKMSKPAVSDDRWKCGRSSNKACGINRNEGWFFIDGCFSRCRREEDCLGSLSTHEVVRGLFRAVYHAGDAGRFILQRIEKIQSRTLSSLAHFFQHMKFIIKKNFCKRKLSEKILTIKNLSKNFYAQNKRRMRKQGFQLKHNYYFVSSFIWPNFWNTLVIVSKQCFIERLSRMFDNNLYICVSSVR